MQGTTLTTSAIEKRLRIGQLSLLVGSGAVIGVLMLAIFGLEAKWMIFTFAGLLLPFIAVLSGNVKNFFLGLMIFAIPLNADIHFMYNPDAGGLHGFVIGLPDICLLVLYLLWGFEIVLGTWRHKIKFFPRISIPYLLLIGVSGISAIQASAPLLSLFDIWQMLKVYLMFIYLANTLCSEREITLVVSMLAFSIALQAVIVLLQFSTDTTLGIIGQETSAQLFKPQIDVSYVKRPGGTVGHANTLGRYFVLLLPLGVSFYLYGRKKILCGFSTALGFVGMIVTMSRSAWIGLGFALGILLILFVKKRLLKLFTIRNLLIVTPLICVMSIVFGPMVIERLISPDFGATLSRLTTAKVALNVIHDHPLIGVGINNYTEVLDSYYDPQDPFTRVAPVHNLYLLFAAEIGLIGLAVFIWLLFNFYRELMRAMKTDDLFLLSVSTGLCAGFFALLLMALSDYVYKHSPPLMTTFWLMAALTFAITEFIARNTDSTNDSAAAEKISAPEGITRRLFASNLHLQSD